MLGQQVILEVIKRIRLLGVENTLRSGLGSAPYGPAPYTGVL